MICTGCVCTHAQADAAIKVVVAHLTIRTGASWRAIFGELQGKSFNGEGDWKGGLPRNSDMHVTICCHSL